MKQKATSQYSVSSFFIFGKGGGIIYENTITIFNYYESSTAAVWYPHTLSSVHLETDRGQIIKKYGPDSTDNAELHIAYTEKDGQKIITDATGKELIWLPPKAWAKQVNSDLPNSITFNSTKDFFMKGEWTGAAIINDVDYADRLSEGFYAYMNRTYDYIFLISSAGGPYTIIPHFEILGA